MAARYAELLRRRNPCRRIEVGCLRGEPSLERAFAGMMPPVVVLPLLLAGGFVFERLRQRLTRAAGAGRFRLLPPLGVRPELTPLMENMALEQCGRAGWPAASVELLLVGHGTLRHSDSGRTLEAHAARLRRATRFARVRTAYLDQPPYLASGIRSRVPERAVAVGFFIDDGPHGLEDVQQALAPCRDRILYAGPLGLCPGTAELVRRMVSRNVTSPTCSIVAT